MPTATHPPVSAPEELNGGSTPSGRERALAFDRELRKQELAERVQRAQQYLDDSATTVNGAESEAPHALRRLEAENRLLMEFHSAVTNSMSWRCLQFVRGLVGRRW